MLSEGEGDSVGKAKVGPISGVGDSTGQRGFVHVGPCPHSRVDSLAHSLTLAGFVYVAPCPRAPFPPGTWR